MSLKEQLKKKMEAIRESVNSDLKTMLVYYTSVVKDIEYDIKAEMKNLEKDDNGTTKNISSDLFENYDLSGSQGHKNAGYTESYFQMLGNCLGKDKAAEFGKNIVGDVANN